MTIAQLTNDAILAAELVGYRSALLGRHRRDKAAHAVLAEAGNALESAVVNLKVKRAALDAETARLFRLAGMPDGPNGIGGEELLTLWGKIPPGLNGDQMPDPDKAADMAGEPNAAHAALEA